VNVFILNTATVGCFTTYCPIILRIMFGRFHITFVIGYYYLLRIAIKFVLNLLTLKTALMVAFLTNFERTSGIYI
jgi:hypothetical protein